jgi:hypothetical protein
MDSKVPPHHYKHQLAYQVLHTAYEINAANTTPTNSNVTDQKLSYYNNHILLLFATYLGYVPLVV